MCGGGRNKSSGGQRALLSASTHPLGRCAMPTQLRKRSTPGSSNKTAITIEIDSSDSNDIAHARLHAAGRGKQAAASGKMKASSSRATSSKAAPQDFSSDSDSSDAIFVATSRRVDKGKQPETKASGGTSARREEPIASKAAKLPTSSPTNSAEENKTRTRQLPTPESLPSEDSESVVEAEPKRLLKADRTPVKDGSRDDLAGRSTGPRTGPSFVERLQANSTPQFSKTFKGKVRSSASTSIVSDSTIISDGLFAP